VPQSSPAQQWPGQRLGLPASGARSIARPGRRIAAFAIDSAAAALIAFAFFDYDRFAVLGVFAVTQIVFMLLLNGGFGHLLVGIRVVPVGGGRLKPWSPFLRTALLCLLVPAVIWDADQRGLHDKAAATMLVRV